MRKLGFLFFEGEEEKSLGRENQAPIAAVEVLYFLFLFSLLGSLNTKESSSERASTVMTDWWEGSTDESR